MVAAAAFQTRARTVDHLGREQIADCPTAISELWKNAYDAYAKNVELHLFDGDIPVAAILDNGHGMSREEFEKKWLTVGTESKTSGFELPLEDRAGLDYRPKQGQKGIGRLSCGALGPLLLLISKRKQNKFIASLIDWRVFENPYLLLNDIRVPVTEFSESYELANELPKLFDVVMGNIWGDSDDDARTQRIALAWDQFSQQEKADGLEETTKENIQNTLISEVFSERHLSKWSVWENSSENGTAMFIADIYYDLEALLSKKPLNEAEDSEKLARELFFETLSSFTDPFSKEKEPCVSNFQFLVQKWHGDIPTPILGESGEYRAAKDFDMGDFEQLEHVIEGVVDRDGYFSGRIKVFGEWIEGYKVKPKQLYKTRKDSSFGAFHIRIGTFERKSINSSFSGETHSAMTEKAQRYGGLRIYRDALKVMPYGRVDNDYFKIEERRSKHAGRYFWSVRNMFGRIAITREGNPNLKDKAGREGFIDNRASKLFREIIENILIDAAFKHFGEKSGGRKEKLADINAQKAQEKAEGDRKKLQSTERKRIRVAIKQNAESLVRHVDKLTEFKSSVENQTKASAIDQLQALKEEIDGFNEVTQSYSLSPIPPNLGRLENKYREYRKHELAAKDIVKSLTLVVNKALSDSTQKSNYEKASEVYRSKLASVNSSITRYAAQGKEMLSKQLSELDGLVKLCRDQYREVMESDLEDLKLDKLTLDFVLNKLDEEQERVKIENAQKLSPYITALERINEQIDLEGLAIHSINESLKYKDELSRLHALAQLGITVEIIGHELESLDMTMSHGLKMIGRESLSDAQKQSYLHVKNAHQTLVEKLRFLSPLKLSGEKVTKRITGAEIYDYVQSYFSAQFAKSGIVLKATDAFMSLHIMDTVSRINPVFINLVNNAQYWVQRSEKSSRNILLDVIDGEVIVADDGPGVDLDDIEQLFTLFFTRKQRGGRGVGLYLSKQNLQAGGHKIRYETRQSKKVLSGANFAIEFKGIMHD